MVQSEVSAVPKPQVNKQFWFDLSKDMVKESVGHIETSAAKLQTLIAWLWPIYTAGAAAGLTLAKLSFPLYITILLALPSIALIAAYFFTVWVQTSIHATFDPVDAADIEKVYSDTAIRKYNRLKYALWFTIIAALLVILALMLTSFSKQPVTPGFQASLNTQNGRDTIALTGHFTASSSILVKITPSSGSAAVKESPFVITTSGELQTNILMDGTSPKYDITITWKDKDGLGSSLQRTVSP